MRVAERVVGLSPSPTLAITAKANQLKHSGVDVVSFGAGEPDFDTPQYIKDAAIAALKKGVTKYTPTAGLPALRQAIAAKFKKENNLLYEPEHIVVSCGAKHSLYNIFQVLCEPGDEVVIPSPYWVSYPEMVYVCGATPVFVATAAANDFKMTAAELRAALTPQTRMLILNSPSNPTGCVYSRAELAQLVRLCVEHSVYIISDEIYEHLIYDGRTHVSAAAVSSAAYNQTFTVNGLSKAYAMTGWRIGYLAGPPLAVQKIIELQDHSTSCPNSIAQMAAIAALTGGDESIAAMRREFSGRRDVMVRLLNAIPGLAAVNPAGAFYVFCSIAGTGMDSMTFSQRLLDEAQVAVIPGCAFGYDDHIRLSFATSREQIEKGIDRIGTWLKGRG